MSGSSVLRGLSEAVALAKATPPGGFGECPMGGGHTIGPWDVAFTGPPAGVSCRRCHQTWIERDGVLVSTYDVPRPLNSSDKEKA